MNLKNKKLGFVATSMVATLLLTSSSDGLPSKGVSVTAEAGTQVSADKVAVSPFKDVVGQSAESLAINKLVEQGYIKVDSTHFMPENPISLQHLARLITDTGLVKQATAEGISASPYIKSVQGLATIGALPPSVDITNEADLSKKVTQGEFEHILKAVFNLSSSASLVDLGIVSAEDYNPDKEITRGDFAVQLHALINDTGTEVQANKVTKKAVASVNPVHLDKSVASTKATTTKAFKDVSPKSEHYHAIHTMRDMGIIHGYGDNTFKPNDPINRANGAALITRYIPMKYEGTAKFPTLSDVTTKNANYTVLVAFQKLGIYNVGSNGKVYPTLAMTRAEMAKSIAMAFELPITPTKKSSFTDVKASDPYSPYIEAMKTAGLTNGYGDGTFKPKTSLSRAHFSSFMFRAIEKVGKPSKDTEKPTVNEEKPTTPITPTTPPTVEEKPSTPPSTGGSTGGGSTVVDYKKPTIYDGKVEYTKDGKVKTSDKQLEDFPLYSMPDNKNHVMDLGGLTADEFNAKTEVVAKQRDKEIGLIGSTSSGIRYVNGDINHASKTLFVKEFAKEGMSEGEAYRLLTYLYYTGDIYEGKTFTAYVKRGDKSGNPFVLHIRSGKS